MYSFTPFILEWCRLNIFLKEPTGTWTSKLWLHVLVLNHCTTARQYEEGNLLRRNIRSSSLLAMQKKIITVEAEWEWGPNYKIRLHEVLVWLISETHRTQALVSLFPKETLINAAHPTSMWTSHSGSLGFVSRPSGRFIYGSSCVHFSI